MSEKLEIRGSLLAKNTALNLIGQVMPLLVAVITSPYIIKGLGVERFGILSLAWVILGYFSLFDLGLGRATTKFVAEALGKGELQRISDIVWISLGFSSIMGIIGGAILIMLTPLLVGHILNIPTKLIEETKLVFYIMSASIIIILITGILDGVLQAYQRFDLVNALKVPSSIMSSVIPVVAIYLGAGLPVIVLFLTIKNLIMVFIYFVFCLKLIPSAKIFPFNLKVISSIFNFGIWLTVIYIVSLVVTRLDRFLIGARLSVSDVSYYSVPYQMVSYLWILPTSFFMTLFPAFSMIGKAHKEDLEYLFARSLKYLILFTGPIALIFILFGEKILELWLGAEFADKGRLVLQILTVGFFLNCQAWIPSTLLQGIGRPDIVAKIFLCELTLYVGIAWWLIGKMGIEGAALAWAIRGGFEFILFFILSWKVISFNFSIFTQNGVIRGLVVLGGLTLIISVIRLLFHTTWLIHALITMGFLFMFVLVVWNYILDGSERSRLNESFRKLVGKA